MSSILKALKKIENKSSRSESFFSMPRPIDTNPENDSGAKRRWSAPRFIAGFLILLLILTVAAVLLTRHGVISTRKLPALLSGVAKKDRPLPPPSSKIFRAKLPSVPAIQPRPPLQETKLTRKQVKPTAPAKNKEELPAIASSKLPKSTMDDRRNPKPPATGGRPQTAATATNGKDTATPAKSAETKNVPAGKAPTGTGKPDKTETYDRINDSKLNLQALAWFNDPSKRMAVINNRIVREGESVDGYQVTKIRRQDVVVSDGRKSWRLEFNLKQ